MAGPIDFDLTLPTFRLEGGAPLRHHVVRGWLWGPEGDAQVVADRASLTDAGPVRVVRRSLHRPELRHYLPPFRRSGPGLDARVPTVLVVHALTGDSRAGQWWGPLIGPDRPLDPRRVRIVCFNLLGSCYGTSGPADTGFPTAADDLDGPASSPQPATVTSWDQARSILLALDALGVSRVHLALGGSLGGMVTLSLAALDPARFERIMPIAATDAASPWLIAWNHVARQAVLADPQFPEDVSQGLSLARQIAMVTYRAEQSLERTQGRAQHGGGWQPHGSYKVQTYLEHQGRKLVARFDGRSYLALIGAMDHHDLSRPPPPPAACERWRHGEALGSSSIGWGLARIRASTLAVGIDTDRLYHAEQSLRCAALLSERGVHAQYREIVSSHGHDAFLIEWAQLIPLVREAMSLPAGQDAMAIPVAFAADLSESSSVAH
ncbi:MAG: alpha/beta fold hydrolase [Kofleriaceae bacterium]